MTEAVGQTVAALGTLWVNVGTPVLAVSPGSATPSDSVGFLQDSLYGVTVSLAVLAVLVGAGRMAWERRGEPLLALLQALITLVVVSGAGLAVIALLVTASDVLAQALIDRSVTGDFSNNLTGLLIGGATVTSPALTSLVVIVLGGAALLMTVIQIVLMVARGGMLVILAGIFPTAAAFTNTAMGKQWFTKCVAWLIAFILYKPAAAIVYAAAFRLVGTDVFSDDGTGVIDLVTGLTLMALALVALPALMRFVTPMVGAMASGGGAAGAAALGAALPTGAIAAGKALANRSSGTGGGGGGKDSSSTSGSRGGTGPSGGDGPSGAAPSGGGKSGPSSTGAKSTGGESTPSGAGGKTPAGAGAKAPAGAGAGAGASGGAGAAGGAAAGGGAAAAGGAAAGPIGAAVVKGVEVADKGRKAAAQAGREAADSATGEEGGPSGSR